jgi:hypothetical protein
MRMKGLLEWKILAAIFAVLIVVSSALVGSPGIRDFFMNSTGNLGDWMAESPLGSFFSTPQKGTTRVLIKLIADNMTLALETPVNISAGKSSISNFRGEARFDFKGNSSEFIPRGSDIRLSTELVPTAIRDVKISKLILNDVGFVVTSEKTNITGSGDDIEIYDFSGDIQVTDHVLLDGNVSKVNDEQWSIS